MQCNSCLPNYIYWYLLTSVLVMQPCIWTQCVCLKKLTSSAVTCARLKDSSFCARRLSSLCLEIVFLVSFFRFVIIFEIQGQLLFINLE